MGNDRAGGLRHQRLKGVDLSDGEAGGGEWQVMIGHAQGLGILPGGIGRKLTGLFMVGTVIDDRAKAGRREFGDIRGFNLRRHGQRVGQGRDLGVHGSVTSIGNVRRTP